VICDAEGTVLPDSNLIFGTRTHFGKFPVRLHSANPPDELEPAKRSAATLALRPIATEQPAWIPQVRSPKKTCTCLFSPIQAAASREKFVHGRWAWPPGIDVLARPPRADEAVFSYIVSLKRGGPGPIAWCLIRPSSRWSVGPAPSAVRPCIYIIALSQPQIPGHRVLPPPSFAPLRRPASVCG